MEKNKTDPFEDVTADQIIDFFSKNPLIKNNQCTVCTQSNWSLINDDLNHLGLLVNPKSGEFRIPPPMLPAAVLVCNHCGNLRIHAMGAIIGGFKNGQ